MIRIKPRYAKNEERILLDYLIKRGPTTSKKFLEESGEERNKVYYWIKKLIEQGKIGRKWGFINNRVKPYLYIIETNENHIYRNTYR